MLLCQRVYQANLKGESASSCDFNFSPHLSVRPLQLPQERLQTNVLQEGSRSYKSSSLNSPFHFIWLFKVPFKKIEIMDGKLDYVIIYPIEE